MNNNKKNILDKLINEFSQKELKKRVWFVTIIGVLLVGLTFFLAYWFFNTHYQVKPGQTPIPFWKMLWMGR